MNNRDVYTVDYDGDAASLTFLKPFSDEYDNYLIVINEDAHGDFGGELIKVDEISKRYPVNGNEIYEWFMKRSYGESIDDIEIC